MGDVTSLYGRIFTGNSILVFSLFVIFGLSTTDGACGVFKSYSNHWASRWPHWFSTAKHSMYALLVKINKLKIKCDVLIYEMMTLEHLKTNISALIFPYVGS